ncbi:CBS domain-containing protein [Cryptosporangium sp. NPDC048952]|uniref:CBS domain-containing protein n=1 Tax=Cryptosporangium sp. NPDC048952 TaxID=3363961 RepID=UPI003722B91F
MSHRTLRDVMTTDVVTADLTTTAKALAEAFDRHRITGVPVLDQAQRPLGVVTVTDLLYKVTYQDDADEWPRFLRRHHVDREKAHAMTARELMTTPAVTVLPDATVVEAARVMERRSVTRLPVVDSVGELVGIVSRSDLVAVFTRPDQEVRDEILSDIIARVLSLSPTAITVRVANGVVTMSGHVERRSQADTLIALVRRVDGVVSVDHEDLHYLDDDTRFVYA